MALNITADHIAAIPASATMRMAAAAYDLRMRGVDIINLAAGEPDFDTADHIKIAAIDALACGQTKYTPVDGLPELKDAIAEKFARENGLQYSRNQISAAPGGKAVIYNALAASLNPGDEVIICAPCWVSYPSMVSMLGGAPVIVPPAHDPADLPIAIRAHITPRSRWLILNSPCNPTGAVLGQDVLLAIAQVLRDHPNIWVLSDDIYEHLVYDGQFHTLAALAPDLAGRILTMNGVSKAYAMTGWRIGYAGGPPELIAAMAKVMGQTTSNACSISQAAAIAALRGPQAGLTAQRALFRSRRDFICRALTGIDGLHFSPPAGAFYLWMDCRSWLGRRSAGGAVLADDEALAMAILNEAYIALVPGRAFHAPGFLRLSFSLDLPALEMAATRLRKFASDLN